MKAFLYYGENSFDLINYTELTSVKSSCDASPDIPAKQPYIDVESGKIPNPYIDVEMTDALTTPSLKEMRSKNLIVILDSISQFYYIGSIIRITYINHVTARIEFNILPIQTNFLNGIERVYDSLVIKSPHKPIYTNNIAQDIVGETITSVNYNSAVSSKIAEYQQVPKIMIVVNKDLSAVGLVNKGFGGVVSGGEIIINNPLPACATKIGGITVPGFIQFFDNNAQLQNFIASCYSSDIKVRCSLFTGGGKYQGIKGYSPSGLGGTDLMISQGDLHQNGTDKIAVGDREKISEYMVPESIGPSNIIICMEIPYQLTTAEDTILESVNLPVTINSDSYFNLPSLLQVKCCSSSGQSFVVDGSNILFNDGNAATGFNCTIAVSLSGIDFYIGESSYILNICKFPQYSYSGNSFENMNNVNNRSGHAGKLSTMTSRGVERGINEWIETLSSGFATNEGPATRNYDVIALDKTSVVGTISATAWTAARFHIETTYLPDAVRVRHNEVYARFGYHDFVYLQLRINTMEPGYWQVSNAQEINLSSLTDIAYINSTISDGVKSQLFGGIYVKP